MDRRRSSTRQWQSAFRFVQALNRFARTVRAPFNSTVDEELPDTITATRSITSSSQELSPDAITTTDPVYLALKQATIRYTGRRSSNLSDSTNTYARSQTSLHDSGYIDATGAYCRHGTADPNLGSSTPQLKLQKSIDQSSSCDETNTTTTANISNTAGSTMHQSRRAPKLDKAIKSISLDCPETSNPLRMPVNNRSGRGNGRRQLVPTHSNYTPQRSIEASDYEPSPTTTSSSSPLRRLHDGSAASLTTPIVYCVAHEYQPPRLPDHFCLCLGDRVSIVAEHGDPDWYHGFKECDPTNTLITFPSTCVAVMHPGESAMRLTQNVSVPESGKRTLRLYRDQVVFAQPDSMHEGCIVVRTERNAKVLCPLHFLMLLP